MRIADLAHKKVAIWGLGREGRSTLKVLRKSLPTLEIAAFNDAELSPEVAVEVGPDVPVFTGKDAVSAMAGFDVVIKSPGISIYRPEIREMRGVVTSATRLWFAEHAGDTTVCITGTKGKSTTTALVAHILKASGLSVGTGGNIGVPLFDLCDLKPDAWVIEMSSYQCSDFDGAPSIAVLLNLFPEHLDWHGDVQTYFRDKTRLLATARTQVVNKLDPDSQNYSWQKPVYFNSEDAIHAGADYIFQGDVPLVPLSDILLRGGHNLSNICAALTVASCLKLDLKTCAAAISSFTPLPHRLMSLGERNGLYFVDDSISTTPQSAMAALECYRGRAVTILVGGFDRGLDWQELAQSLAGGPAYAVITMPDTGPGIAARMRESSRAGAGPLLYEARSLADAVAIAQKITPCGGTVLLSPAAPSYGHFKNFEHRGRAFAEAAGF